MTNNVIQEMIGKTMTEAHGYEGGREIRFVAEDGTNFIFLHHQDCCENVRVEEIIGDLNDLVGSPIYLAEESSNRERSEGDYSQTWTFYKFGTNKGYVTIRWLGTSNGYYSERVSLDIIAPKNDEEGSDEELEDEG